ncbi:amino acid ABC transporter permease [Ochrobactrum sp. Marseille-Q0166]|uniref:amino acid ABC transporter permease n=2 Tax=Brucella/Ochrobactrum group TaxID=2826938 RepID=UPI001655E849|nr:amino acid ABC transporter permease [Ochrobactrum sp. Marseille-Q0166]
MSDTHFIRTEMHPALPAPGIRTGAFEWVRRSLFGSVKDSIFTVLALLLIGWLLPPALKWLFIDASWSGSGREACSTIAQGGIQPDGWSGACWAFVNAKMDQFIFGRYPMDERWRPIAVFVLFTALLVPLLISKVGHKALNAALMFVVLPVVSVILLIGGVFGLSYVETSLWGGLLVTLTLSFVGISVSLPLGVLLALGRRSSLPVIRMLSTAFIELVRGIPLLAVLFMASVVLPLFLPQGFTVDKFIRALIGVSLFASAYMAEVVRGGLQAMPKGQYEGADALGLTYWQKMILVVLPQALKLVIPGIVNTFIGLFKDTSLVTIIAMFDLLGIVRLNFSDANWASPVTPVTGLIFAGFVFWIFCFAMSRYSIFMERRLDTGHKR